MNLIADTGIQFHKVPLDLNADVLKHKRHFSEEQRDGKLWLISALKWTAEDIFINREHLEAERMTSECDFDADGLSEFRRRSGSGVPITARAGFHGIEQVQLAAHGNHAGIDAGHGGHHAVGAERQKR